MKFTFDTRKRPSDFLKPFRKYRNHILAIILLFVAVSILGIAQQNGLIAPLGKYYSSPTPSPTSSPRPTASPTGSPSPSPSVSPTSEPSPSPTPECESDENCTECTEICNAGNCTSSGKMFCKGGCNFTSDCNCTGYEECDDGSECTTDYCYSNLCHYMNTEGSCNNGSGVCCDGACCPAGRECNHATGSCDCPAGRMKCAGVCCGVDEYCLFGTCFKCQPICITRCATQQERDGLPVGMIGDCEIVVQGGSDPACRPGEFSWKVCLSLIIRN